MIEFKRFPLGLRFAMTADAALTVDAVWELLFSRVPAARVEGLALHGAWDDTAENEPEPAYICIFSGMSLTRAKRLYHAIARDQLLCSYLTVYRPFVQNNWLEKCGGAEYLGRIGSDGRVEGGDAAYGAMRFSDGGTERTVTKTGEPPHILVAAESFDNACPPADVARRVMRAAVDACPEAVVTTVRLSDGGRGTVDTMVAACGGRYRSCSEIGVRYGVLPDRTVVLETEQLSDEQVLEAFERIMRDGYQKFLLAAGKRRMHVDFPQDIEITVLSNPVPAQPYGDPQVAYASGVETALAYGGFLRRCGEADAVVLATVARDESCALLGATADTIRFYCEKNHVPFSILARLDTDSCIVCPHGRAAEKVAASGPEAAAHALFDRLKAENA